jgi:radical SAM superfamily enzyme YgiQ (UPF0313 family)
MKLVLVGADFEENLGIGMIAAAARQAGHEVAVVPFDEPESAPRVAACVAAEEPDVVGLSIQFQHRVAEFLGLARWIRRAGFAGHLTCGGQPPTLAWRDFLERGDAIDSVVLHDGEHTIVELLARSTRGAVSRRSAASRSGRRRATRTGVCASPTSTRCRRSLTAPTPSPRRAFIPIRTAGAGAPVPTARSRPSPNGRATGGGPTGGSEP